uniref:RNase H type-1 domain-containing protein n=1 Tax=Cannabis sativa TaxID=3483 RepID=A0A803Q0R0_CANSA
MFFSLCCVQCICELESLFLIVLSDDEGHEDWITPIGNTIKINVDAVIFSNQNKYRYGWVAQNSSGQLIMTWTISWMGVVDLVIAEAIEVKEVLRWLKEIGRHDVVVESDSLLTI